MDASMLGSVGWLVAFAVFLIWFWNSLYIIKEWERGAVLRLGRMLPDAKGAGLRIILWPIETLYRIPLRIVTLDVPPQDIITKDNVSVKVNAVCYFKVVDANRALREIENYLYATSQLAQTTLRSVVGQFQLDEILSERDHAAGEFEAAQKLADAAKVLETQPSAIQLRYLQTLTEIGVEKNTTIVFPLPVDIISSWVNALGGKQK